MKKVIAFVILYSSFVIFLCHNAKAQWCEPYGSYQWEEAQIQQLTNDDLPNKIVGLYIDDGDMLYLFYSEGVRDTITGFVYDHKLLFITKEKGREWSQPEEIETSVYIIGQNRKGRVWMDTETGIVHITYFYGLYPKMLYYTNSTIPDWEFDIIDSLSEEKLQRYGEIGMAFDTMGNVHLAWNVDYCCSLGFDWYRVMYANNSTGEWVKQQVSEPIWLGLGQGPPLFLAVQKNGAVHIVYNDDGWCDLACFPFYVRNDSLNSTNWITDTVPRPSRPLWHYWAGPIKVDDNDRVHLLTTGCIDWDCAWPDMKRTFYYYKQAENSIWQGPEQIPDTTFGARAGITQLLVDEEGIPFASYGVNPGRVYFTDRKQGFWQQPYQILDSTYSAYGFSFVLDSEGRGHAVFAGCSSQFLGQDDSLEIFYYGAPPTSVEDTLREQGEINFRLFQNYPNPFNSVTSIQYTVYSSQNQLVHTTLKIYNILGKEVRELVNARQPSGNYSVIWDGKNNKGKEVASGIYFCVLKRGGATDIRKMLLIK